MICGQQGSSDYNYSINGQHGPQLIKCCAYGYFKCCSMSIQVLYAIPGRPVPHPPHRICILQLCGDCICCCSTSYTHTSLTLHLIKHMLERTKDINYPQVLLLLSISFSSGGEQLSTSGPQTGNVPSDPCGNFYCMTRPSQSTGYLAHSSQSCQMFKTRSDRVPTRECTARQSLRLILAK